MKDFLSFKKLTAPLLIQILYWVGTFAVILVAVSLIISSRISYLREQTIYGFLLLFLGPVALRLWAEFMTVVFRASQNLADMRDVAVREAHERYEERLVKNK